MRGPPDGLRARLLLGTAATLVAALLAVDVTAYVALSRFLEARVEKNIDAVVDRGAAQVDLLGGTPVTPTIVDRLVPVDGYVAMYRSDDLVLERQPDGTDQDAVLAGEAPAGYRLREVMLDDPLPVRVGGVTVPVDRVVVGVSSEEDKRTLQRFVRVQIVSGLIILALALLAAMSILRAGLAPLRELAETARAVGRGERREVRVNEPTTEVGEVAQALDQALGQRQRSEDRVRDFVADASHELRTPLTTVHGWADLYLSGGVDDWEDVDLAMHRIRDETARMTALVDQLLALARLDAGAPTRPTDVDLTALCAQVVADAAASAPEHRLAIEAPGVVLVRADESSLRQVVSNLVTNATRHTPPRTSVIIKLDVMESGGLRGRHVRLSVCDNGPGLPAEERERAFERFWRHERTSASGTGLGLAIVSDLVSANGGRVALEETAGGGLTASVDWPTSAGAPRGH